MKLFPLLLLQTLLLSESARAGVDLSMAPSPICEPVASLSERTFSCAANQNYMNAVAACVANLNKLEAELGAELAVIAASGAASQRAQNGTGGQGYAFSAASLAYLKRAAQAGLADLEPYPRHVILPEDFFAEGDQDLWENAEARDCYGGTLKRIEAGQAELTRKIAVFNAREKESLALEQKLKTRGETYLSRTQSASARPAASAAPASKPASNGKSSITGIEQDLRKRRLAPAPQEKP